MTRRIHNPELFGNAKALRKNQTDEERRLWYEFLCRLPVKFTRQKVIGKYIVDFCCVSQKIIIELDGAQHFEDNAIQRDKDRDLFLNSLGYTVFRYTNYELNRDFKSICEDIWNKLNLE